MIYGLCVKRPEVKVCPQCRNSLTGKLSRNRVIENLARKIKEGLTFYYTSTVKSVVQNSESKLSWLWLGGGRGL